VRRLVLDMHRLVKSRPQRLGDHLGVAAPEFIEGRF
jgi:hypothetical protein